MPKALAERESPRGLEYAAMVVAATFDSISFRDMLTAGAAFILLTAAAQEAIDGPLAPPLNVEAEADPVLVQVGSTPIRVSDARAQAVLTEKFDAEVLPPEALFQTGLVDEAADQVALANAAQQAGLHQSLEIRAQLALARRRILSSAYLEAAVRRAVTDEAVRAVYQARVEATNADQVLELRRILVSSEPEALAVTSRIDAGVPFENLARRQSLDMETRNEGGLVGHVRFSDLPGPMAAAVRNLALGEVSAPVKGEQGWYLLLVEARRAVKLPPYEVMRPQIEAEMRERIVAETVQLARAAVPIRLASYLEPARTPVPLASVAASAW